MHIAMPLLQPTIERNAKLERALSLPQKFSLIKAERGVKQVNLGDCCFPYAYSSDFIGFRPI